MIRSNIRKIDSESEKRWKENGKLSKRCNSEVVTARTGETIKATKEKKQHKEYRFKNYCKQKMN